MRSPALKQDGAATESLATAIIDEIAAHENVDPMDLNQPLYEAIDVEALESLFPGYRTGDGTSSGYVVFSYHGYAITVSSQGDVEISETGRR